MKKAFLALSVSALVLSMGGIAAASPVAETSVVDASITAAADATITVTWVPASGIQERNQNVRLKGLGSDYVMQSGSNWLLWEGSDVIKLSGATATSIGYGKATVYAYKGNGNLLGAYFFEVIR